MEPPSHRACAHCRSQKVRCLPSSDNPDVCQRCQKAGRSCVFTPLQKRKQRKRTDTRVAELEREMRAMRSMLKNKNDIGRQDESSQVETRRAESLWDDSINYAGISMAQQSSDNDVEPNIPMNITTQRESLVTETRIPLEDVISKGLLTMETASHLIETYKTFLYHHYPMVYIPPAVTADILRRTKPTLFLAILAAAATSEEPNLSLILGAELLRTFAERALINSEKSLELIQALIISAAWYSPPRRFGQLKYYEYIGMASTMSMEIGIGMRSNQYKQRPPPAQNVHPAEDVRNPDLSMSARQITDGMATTEAKRTFVAVFCLAAGCALSLRRPLMLKPTTYLRECLEHLETCSDATTADRTLVAWTKLSLIGVEVSDAFSFDDPENAASIADPRTQLMLRDYDRRLEQWYANVAEADFTVGLKVLYYYGRIVLTEVALHIDHAPQDFKAPYQMGCLQVKKDVEVPTKFVVDCIAKCIEAAHGMMDTYLITPLETARALPVLSAVRISYAAFVVAKLCLSDVSKESRIASLMDRSSLKAESYMDRMILRVRDVIGPKGCRVPAIFLALLFKVRQWCANPELINQADPGLAFTTEQTERDEVQSQIQNSNVSDTTGSNYNSPAVADPAVAIANAVQPMNGLQPTNTTMQGNNNFAETMELDENFFDFLNDVNFFQGGGLTGLDDWAAQPSEMLSMSSTINTR